MIGPHEHGQTSSGKYLELKRYTTDHARQPELQAEDHEHDASLFSTKETNLKYHYSVMYR